YWPAPKTSVVGSRELRKLSHVRCVVRHSNFELPMSALGQKQTYAVQHGMSALPPIATSIAFFGMSALRQKREGDLRGGVVSIMTMLDRLMIAQASNQQ